jgi:hypothetical protein
VNVVAAAAVASPDWKVGRGFPVAKVVDADDHADQVVRGAAVAELRLDPEAGALVNLRLVAAASAGVLPDHSHEVVT